MLLVWYGWGWYSWSGVGKVLPFNNWQKVVFSASDKWLEYRFGLCLVSIPNFKEQICSVNRFPTCFDTNSSESSCGSNIFASGRPGKSAPAHPEVFLDNVGHFPEALAYLMRFVYCKKNIWKKCRKWNGSLHLSFCFQTYHQEEKL